MKISRGDAELRERCERLERECKRLTGKWAECGLHNCYDIRNDGWTVAVHNDYRKDGKAMTFWLFTHPDGRWVKGEGEDDAHALHEIRCQIAAMASAKKGSAK